MRFNFDLQFRPRLRQRLRRKHGVPPTGKFAAYRGPAGLQIDRRAGQENCSADTLWRRLDLLQLEQNSRNGLRQDIQAIRKFLETRQPLLRWELPEDVGILRI